VEVGRVAKLTAVRVGGSGFAAWFATLGLGWLSEAGARAWRRLATIGIYALN